MTETTPDYAGEDEDQILALVETLRQDVMFVLAPRLAYHVDIACRLITSYRLRERRAAAMARMMNGEESDDAVAQARKISDLLSGRGSDE